MSEKVQAQLLDMSSSSEFAELAEGVWPNINVDKESVDIEKPKLDATGMWNPNGRELAPALLIALKQLSPM